MTMVEDDLLAALQELYDTSKEMTSGHLPTADLFERYQQALAWAERVLKRAT